MTAAPDWAYYFNMRLNAGWLHRSSMVHGMGRRTAAMKYLAAALMLLLLGAPDASTAQPFPRRGGEAMQSLDSIVSMIRQRFPGQLSDVQGPSGGRYRIKWLTPDGRVLWIDADARTGQILGVDGGGGPGPGPRNFAPPGFGEGGDAQPWAGRGRFRER